jgi:hypothetical protein
MASFKYLTENDRVVSTTTLETIITQSASGGSWTTNVRPNGTTLPNELFYVFGSSATVENVGISYGTPTAGGSSDYQVASKRIYDQMAHTLLGYNANGSLKTFSSVFGSDASLGMPGNLAFFSFPRAVIKDKIMSGSVSITANSVVYTDKDPAYEVQTGEARKLMNSAGTLCLGAVFYEAGIVAVNVSRFSAFSPSPATMYNAALAAKGTGKVEQVVFNPATELNSTVYFCRAYNNEFNYSSNPTYLNDSMIIVKDGDPMEEPSAYITSIGLYDDNNQLLAVAKLSEPIKKTASTELIIRTRLDF